MHPAHLMDERLTARELATLTPAQIEEREAWLKEMAELLPAVSANDRRVLLDVTRGLVEGRKPLPEWMQV